MKDMELYPDSYPHKDCGVSDLKVSLGLLKEWGVYLEHV